RRRHTRFSRDWSSDVCSSDLLEQWRTLDYAELAAEILALYIDDIPRDELRRLTAAAYSKQAFPGEKMVPLKPLEGEMSLLGLSRSEERRVGKEGRWAGGQGGC